MNGQLHEQWDVFGVTITVPVAPRALRRHFARWADPAHQRMARLVDGWADFYSNLYHARDLGYITDIERYDMIQLLLYLWGADIADFKHNGLAAGEQVSREAPAGTAASGRGNSPSAPAASPPVRPDFKKGK